MIDLDAMDKDPWSAWPVDKMELRILVEENEKLRAANVYLCSRVDYLPYCHEIDRLRAELRRIAHAPHGKVYCADGHEEAVLIARAAIEEEASHD